MLGGFAERFALSREQAVRLGCAFGGGMASSGRTCGAVVGAMLVLGLAHGPSAPDDQAAKGKTYGATRELWRRFEERHGSITCRDLLGVDIGTPEGRETALRTGLFTDRCPVFVRAAAEVVEQLL